ncbi:copper chaperone PCu(A)C [Thalassobaculum sp.]
MFGAVLLYSLLSGLAGGTALSDTATDLVGAFQVHSVSASAAPAGACTKVQLMVDNESRDDVQILGVSSDMATRARILANVGSRQPVALDSFIIPSGQSVEFSQSRWFELCGLTRSLAPGEAFAAELRTPRWTSPLIVHVH